MPKQRISRESVLDAAFALARERGIEGVLVKDIAARLGCSVQPIYSCCANMEALRAQVAERAARFVRETAARGVDPQDLFRSTGRAYLQVARAEPQLFRLFVLRRRTGVSSWEELYRAEADPRVAGAIAAQLGVSEEEARQLHAQMLVYTIGLGTIFSVTEPGIPVEDMYARQDAAYEAFAAQLLRTRAQKEETACIPTL